MKKLWPIVFTLVLSFSCKSQQANSLYLDYAKPILAFSTKQVKIKVTPIESRLVKEIDIKNNEGALLRFKVDELGKLRAYYFDLTFILYEYTKQWVTRITYFGPNGRIVGAPDFEDQAVSEFVVKKPNELKLKLKLVDAQEGNISMKDENEDLVLKRDLNSKNQLIREYYISSDYYWDVQHLEYRP